MEIQSSVSAGNSLITKRRWCFEKTRDGYGTNWLFFDLNLTLNSTHDELVRVRAMPLGTRAQNWFCQNITADLHNHWSETGGFHRAAAWLEEQSFKIRGNIDFYLSSFFFFLMCLESDSDGVFVCIWVVGLLGVPIWQVLTLSILQRPQCLPMEIKCQYCDGGRCSLSLCCF